MNRYQVFFKDLLTMTFAKSKRLIRVFVLIVLISFNFIIGLVPSASMEPTILINDLVIFSKNRIDIDRGDIISFKCPTKDEIYVKRVIGLPGDEVEILEGIVYVNNEMQEERYISEKSKINYLSTILKEDEFWVMGDNRNNSEDSTYFGAIQRDSIRGRALFVLLPFNRIQKLYE